MKLHVISHIFMIAFLSSLLGIGSASAQGLCEVSAKRSGLARDQRDDVRMKCLKTSLARIKTKSCLRIANSMEYSNNAEDARLVCLYDMKKQNHLPDCMAIAESMEYPDSGDEVRWECLRRHNRVLTKKECNKIAQKMSYPGNTRRGMMYCSDELPRK